MKSKFGGFTLIELIVVLVILGILAITAAPKFINLQSDARKVAMHGLASTFKSGVTIVRAKAALKGIGEDNKPGYINIGTESSPKMYML